MTSEAQKKAMSRYMKRIREEGKVKYVQVAFYESDLDLHAYVKEQGGSRFIKQLIRDHMNR